VCAYVKKAGKNESEYALMTHTWACGFLRLRCSGLRLLSRAEFRSNFMILKNIK
jgi:hypothetical protein